MKVHLKDRLLLGFISCTYWVHVLSQHGFPPGVPPPSGMPPQQYQHQQQQQYQHHQQQQYQQQPPQQMQYQQHPNMNQGQFQQPPQHMQQQQYHPPPGMPQGQQQQHHQGQQQQHHQGQQQQHHQGQQQQHHQGQQQHHQGGHAHQPHDFKRESHDREHIADHLRDVVNKPVEQMTEEEMEFHYFKLHDYDNNNKLDGTEITKALTHFEREGHHDPNQPVRTLSDDEIAEIVDAVLKEDDLNGDGYVEYSEFVVAQRKARANMPKTPGHESQGGQH